MSYKQLNLVVKEIEGYFFAKPESGKYSLLAYQLNPIKAAMQLQELLTKIQEQYPMFKFRLQILKQEIID